MSIQACTIIARNYLPAARVLARSFLVQHPGSKFTTLVIDDRRRAVDHRDEKFEILRPEDLGFEQHEFLELAGTYDVMELATATKPWLLEHLVREANQEVVYLDPDIVVYAPLDDVSALASDSELVVTPHVTKPMPRDRRGVSETHILASGIFNLGFVAVGLRSFNFLEFWKERLRRECVIDARNMRFVDQRWVDFAPGMFAVEIVKDPTCNVAYWNLDHRVLTWEGSHYAVDGKPLRFFHFSGYKPDRPELLSSHQGSKARILLSEWPVVARICGEYGQALRSEGYELCAKLPYAYARLDNGLKLDNVSRGVYREALRECEQGCERPPNPFENADRFLEWLNSPAQGRRLSRYLASFWGRSEKMRTRFPSAEYRDFEGFLAWCRSEAAEGRLDYRLVESAHHQSSGSRAPDSGSPAEVPKYLPPGIRVSGYLRAELGVGQLGRLAARAIDASEIPWSTYIYNATLSRQEHRYAAREGGDFNVNLVCINADELPEFAWRMGPEFFRDRYTIGLWAWELEEFPDRFDKSFDLVDEVWALSDFARDAIAARTSTPVFTFSPPILPPAVPVKRVRTGINFRNKYRFLFCFDMMSVFERKNPLGLIKAFDMAVSPNDGAALVIKAVNGEHNLAKLEELRLAASRRPDVFVFDGYLTDAENVALFSDADCYVSLHRSEGFGLTIAEAMALGKPAIATAYSGNLEFMTNETSYLVPYVDGEVPADCEPYRKGARWAEPDLQAAARMMRHVFTHQDEAVAVGERARAQIAERHSLSRRVPFIKKRFEAAQSALADRFFLTCK